jgi:hypothetical protein
MKKFSLIAILFLAINANAMEQHIDTNWYVTFEKWSGEKFVITPQHEKHSGKIQLILIGHMVSGPFLPAANKLKTYGQKIVYNFCFGLDGKCYEGRPLQIKPAMMFGKNDNSCGVGLIMNTCAENDIKKNEIDDLVVQSWAKILAYIALELGFTGLEWGTNIVGQYDLDPKKFPNSPGPKFYKKKDAIIALANEYIVSGESAMTGNLF